MVVFHCHVSFFGGVCIEKDLTSHEDHHQSLYIQKPPEKVCRPQNTSKTPSQVVYACLGIYLHLFTIYIVCFVWQLSMTSAE